MRVANSGEHALEQARERLPSMIAGAEPDGGIRNIYIEARQPESFWVYNGYVIEDEWTEILPAPFEYVAAIQEKADAYILKNWDQIRSGNRA